MELWPKMEPSLGLLFLNRGSYTSAHVLLNLLNEMSKSDKMRALSIILSFFFATSLITSIMQGHECWILFFHRTLELLRNNIFVAKT